MCNQCFKSGVVRLGWWPARLIRVAPFASKKALICVGADDVGLEKLLKTRWS
jgi:hypothetical protein